MGPTNTIGYLLQHLSGVLAKQSDQALQEQLGIGFSQFKILRVLQNSPKTQQRIIAEWLGQTEASISRQIRLMIDKGLLRVTISPGNRREHLTEPTSKGLRITEQAITVLNRCHADMFNDLGPAKQQQLAEILTQMHGYTCQAGKVGACHHPSQLSNQEGAI